MVNDSYYWLSSSSLGKGKGLAGTRSSLYTVAVRLRNVTVSLDEETARWARIEAARQDTSVSKLIGTGLRRYMIDGKDYERAMRSYLSRRSRPLKRRVPYPGREALHDRAGLR